jgi:hypothetical protein
MEMLSQSVNNVDYGKKNAFPNPVEELLKMLIFLLGLIA